MKDKMIGFLLKFMRVEVAVAGVISKGDKVMLTRRAKVLPEGGKWCLPGGHVKKWEKAENAVKREIKEEINLNVKKSKLLFVHEEFVKRIGLHAVVFVYSVEVSGKEKANFEVSEIGWFNRKGVEKLDMAFTHREILEKFWRKK